MQKVQDRVGEIYGDLTIIRKGSRLPSRHYTWVCVCVCGTELEIAYPSLKNGRSTSCGCSRKRNSHNMSESASTATPQQIRTYKIWKDMKYRCNKDHKNYGGRGITVCERWDKFENFLEDMGLCPANSSIERLDVNGNYEPSNCIWLDLSLQGRNKRNTIRVMFDSREITLIELCEMLDLHYGTVYQRIIKLNMSVEDAIKDVDYRFKQD